MLVVLIYSFLVLGIIYFIGMFISQVYQMRRDVVVQNNFKIYQKEIEGKDKYIEELKKKIKQQERDNMIAQDLWFRNIDIKGLYIGPKGVKMLDHEPIGVFRESIDKVDNILNKKEKENKDEKN